MVLALLLFLASQDDAAIQSTPFDRVVTQEITVDDPLLIEGKGRTQLVEHVVEFDGTLHLWTKSKLDLYLRVDDARQWTTLAEDDDSGGGRAPHVALSVEAGDELAVLVASAAPLELGAYELHLIAAPESEASRAAGAMGREAYAKCVQLARGGDFEAARARLERVVTELVETPAGERSQAVAMAAWELGNLAHELGDATASLRALHLAQEHLERTLGADHPDLQRARMNLGNALILAGDLHAARDVFRWVLDARERLLPPGDPAVLRARENLAVALYRLGDLNGACALVASVLEDRQRLFEPTHPEVLLSQLNLASMRREQGEVAGARTLQESVLVVYERTLAADHPRRLLLEKNLALSMREQGDLAAARALEERVLERYEHTLPDDNDDVLRARQNLALTLSELGDLPGARALLERVLEARARTLAAGHPDLLFAQQSLALVLRAEGQLESALALETQVLEARERALPEDHPDLLRARENLAATLIELGEPVRACELLESSLKAHERLWPEGSLGLWRTRLDLGAARYASGDVGEARATFAAVLRGFTSAGLITEHPFRLVALWNLAAVITETEGVEAGRVHLQDLQSALLARAVSCRTLAPREARAVLTTDASHLGLILLLASGAEAEASARLFQLIETRRLVAVEAAAMTRASGRDPGLSRWILERSTARARLGDLVAGLADEGDPGGDLQARLLELTTERDRAARQVIAARGLSPDPIDVRALAEMIPDGAAFVSFLSYASLSRDSTSKRLRKGQDHLVAFVLPSASVPVRVDLGPTADLSPAVELWRTALGNSTRRGVALEEIGEREVGAGSELRERLLDPLLSSMGEGIETIYVCADDLVHLVPLDALPWGDQRVGDRVRVVSLPSLAPLLRSVPTSVPAAKGAPTLLALGAPSFETKGASPAGPSGSGAPLEDMSRSGQPARFLPLLQSGFEVEAVGALFEKTFDRAPVLLTDREATKAALAEHAPRARFLHLATHGWFAPETVPSILDGTSGRSAGWSPVHLNERVSGFAPMTLCGLALAGANRGRDSLGRVPGILTAEELCAFDLTSCDLAVLSACETNVGIRRAGQGIASLQAALHAAGARSSITSLWKVDDAATRRLMELFYTHLWVEQMGKADALWQAKVAMREAGHPVRDWAGWMLAGEAGGDR